MYMKRVFIPRNEITHFDNLIVSENAVWGYTLPSIGSKDTYKDILLEVYSAKGNKLKEIVCYPIEIENVSNLFYWLRTNKKIRASERVFADGVECKVQPIARLKHNGTLICSIQTI